MLQHMVEAEILDLVLSGVDLLIRKSKVRFDDERARVPSLGRAGVIRTRIAAFGENVGDVTIL